VVENATLATRWLHRAAELGSGPAACRLAEQLDGGDPNALTKEQVVALLASNASKGDTTAQTTLAQWYLEGRYGIKDFRLAFRWFYRAASAGNAFAQAWLGDAYSTGQGVKADPSQAAKWYERAALQGHGGATRVLTRLGVAAGEHPEEMARLFNLWLSGAKRGDAIAQRVVGDFYRRGVGVERSATQSEHWLSKAIEQGDTAAMVLLGGLMLESSDDSARFPRAVELFGQAAAQGNTDAEYNLGVCFRRGFGVTPDRKQAELHYRSAARRDHESAQLALGDLIAQSAATELEWHEAIHWYRLAADRGNAVAKVRLTEVAQSRLPSQTTQNMTAAQ
jgi:TPR repeat protein